MFWTEQRTILQSTSPRTSAAYLCFSSFEPLIRKTSVHAPGCRLSACGFLPVLTSCPNRVFQVFDLPAFLSPTTATKSRSAIGDVPFWSALTILHWGFDRGFAAYFISRDWVGGMCSQRLSAGLKSGAPTAREAGGVPWAMRKESAPAAVIRREPARCERRGAFGIEVGRLVRATEQDEEQKQVPRLPPRPAATR